MIAYSEALLVRIQTFKGDPLNPNNPLTDGQKLVAVSPSDYIYTYGAISAPVIISDPAAITNETSVTFSNTFFL